MRRHSWERISQLIQSVVKNLEDLTLEQIFDVAAQLVARRMGSPRHANYRRRRARKGPELACVRAPLERGGGTCRGEKDEVTSCPGSFQSAWQKPPVRRKGGRAGLAARVSGRHVVRGRQSSPTLDVRPGEQARLVKAVKIQVRWAAAQFGQDRRLPSVVAHSRL